VVLQKKYNSAVGTVTDLSDVVVKQDKNATQPKASAIAEVATVPDVVAEQPTTPPVVRVSKPDKPVVAQTPKKPKVVKKPDQNNVDRYARMKDNFDKIKEREERENQGH
jgi:hypothetical protein